MTNLVKELRSFYLDLQKILKPNVSVEVGAFKAEFSTQMRKISPMSECFAFEANKFNYEDSRQNVLSYGVNYINLAITDYVGEVEFLIQEGFLNGVHYEKDPGNNSILKRSDNNIYYSKHTVACTKLDAFFEDSINKKNTFCLWIDAEGASKQVLMGAERFLNSVQSIFIEVEHERFWKEQWLANDVNDVLSEHNFVHVAHDTEYINQNNAVYLRSDLFDNKEIVRVLNRWYLK